MSNERIAILFNEWQRRYIDDPSKFESDWASIKATMAELEAGEEPSYGASCAAYLAALDAELQA